MRRIHARVAGHDRFVSNTAITGGNRLKRSVTIALEPRCENDEMTRLNDSVHQARPLLSSADLGADAHVRELLELTHQRRSMDLPDLSPARIAATT